MQHNAYNRLDYRVFDQLRLFGSLELRVFAHGRVSSVHPDSVGGQSTPAPRTDPNTLRSDAGTVNPISRLFLRWRLDPDFEIGGQRPLRLLLQQQRTARNSGRHSLRVSDHRQRGQHGSGRRTLPRFVLQHLRFRQYPEQSRRLLTTPTSARASMRDVSYFVGRSWAVPTPLRAATSGSVSPTTC